MLMIRKFFAGCALAIGIQSSCPACAAGMAAQDMWEIWKSGMEDWGFPVLATEERSDGALKVSDMIASMSAFRGSMPLTIDVPETTFLESGNDTVSLGISNSVRVAMGFGDGRNEDVRAIWKIGFSDMDLTLSGASGSISTEYFGDEFSMGLTEFAIGDEHVLPAFLELKASDLVGMPNLNSETDIAIESRVGIGKLSYSFSVADGEYRNLMSSRGAADGAETQTFICGTLQKMESTEADCSEYLNR